MKPPDDDGAGHNYVPFHTIDWGTVPRKEHNGATGTASSQRVEYPGFNVRMVEYSAGYRADHWCSKGHIVHCLEGAFVSMLDTGKEHSMTAGMTYIVSDDMSRHMSATEHGVKLLIIEGIMLR
jgi:hypothetical protein